MPHEALRQEFAELVTQNPASQKLLMAEVTAARQQFARFCATGDSEAFLAEVKEKRIVADSVSRKIRAGDAPRTTLVLNQWETTMLSNPALYSLGLDTWLDRNVARMLPEAISARQDQVNFIVDELFRRLSGEEPAANGIRPLFNCAVRFRCKGVNELPEQERQAALTLAAELELKIRQQRWDRLILH